jgi:ubiquinone biosynthesis protein COQ4
MAFRLREARRALDSLSANPDDTEQAIRAINAMAGNSAERLFKRFQRSRHGASILREKRELYDVLSDIDRLGAMPEGSLGHGIWKFYTTEEISAQGLKGASEAAANGQQTNKAESDRALFGRRSRELHDVFHVLTGYGRDMRGEMAVLAFTYSQTKNTGIGYMVLRSLRNAGWNSELGKLIRQGYWRGRRARWLVAEDWEALLPQPLEKLRETLGVGPAPEYEQLRSPGAPILTNTNDQAAA